MWKLVFTGDLVTGFERQEAIENLADLLNKEPDEVAEQLFVGQPVVIDTVATEAEANRWRRDFVEAGALLMVLPADEQTPGGHPYAGADPVNTNVEEPTPASVTSNIPGVRRRNRAFVALGMVAVFIAIVVLLFAERSA